MAFKFYKSLGEENFPYVEDRPTTAEEVYTKGEGLVLSSGTLTKATGTTQPTYIAAKAYTAPDTGNLDLPVYPVLPQYEYLTTFAADASSVEEGEKVTVHTDGAQATATTADGVVTISRKLGDGDTGTEAIVRFLPVDTDTHAT